MPYSLYSLFDPFAVFYIWSLFSSYCVYLFVVLCHSDLVRRNEFRTTVTSCKSLGLTHGAWHVASEDMWKICQFHVAHYNHFLLNCGHFMPFTYFPVTIIRKAFTLIKYAAHQFCDCSVQLNITWKTHTDLIAYLNSWVLCSWVLCFVPWFYFHLFFQLMTESCFWIKTLQSFENSLILSPLDYPFFLCIHPCWTVLLV